MIFFEIRSAYDRKRDRDINPVLSYDDGDAHAGWRGAVDAAPTAEAASACPALFKTEWVGSRKQKMAGLSDWPNNLMLGPVCSQRMWEKIQPLCRAVWWVALPAENDENCGEWGVLKKVPMVDLDNWQPSISLPHFFRCANDRGHAVSFVSCEFKKIVEENAFHGVELTPFDVSVGKAKEGWRQFLEY